MKWNYHVRGCYTFRICCYTFLNREAIKMCEKHCIFCVCEQLIRLPFCTYIIVVFCAKSSAEVNHKILATGKFHTNFIAFTSLTFSAKSCITNSFTFPTSWLKSVWSWTLLGSETQVPESWLHDLYLKTRCCVRQWPKPLQHGRGPGCHTRKVSPVVRSHSQLTEWGWEGGEKGTFIYTPSNCHLHTLF